MRASAPGQSALLMADVAESLARRGVRYAVIGAMAAAVHGVVRASLDADAVLGAHLAVGRELQREFTEKGCGADLRVGAVKQDDGATHITVASDWPWRGKLRFDVPRHAEYLHIPSDYPRLNQFPEWLTIRADQTYRVNGAETPGETLRTGVDASCDKDAPFKIEIK